MFVHADTFFVFLVQSNNNVITKSRMSAQSLILFVCTSNTCRSPIAEGFARQWLLQNGLDGYIVSSRSLSTDYEPVGSPPNAHGKSLMMDLYGIDISMHRSQLLSDRDVENSTFIIGVTKSHTAHISKRFTSSPGLENKIIALNRDIPDPWHADRSVYEECAVMLKESVERTLEALNLGQCSR